MKLSEKSQNNSNSVKLIFMYWVMSTNNSSVRIEATLGKLQQVRVIRYFQILTNTQLTSHISLYFPRAVTILQILLSFSPLLPLTNIALDYGQIENMLALHHSDISLAMGIDWNGFPLEESEEHFK